MSYKIVVDSCGEIPEEKKNTGIFEQASLSIDIDGFEIVDDETFDQQDFLRRVSESPNCPKSSCPSPERYMEAYSAEVDHVYAVTLSSKLSGSNNSAELGKKLYQEEHPEKKIHVIDSQTASIGQTILALKLEELEEAGNTFEEIVEKIEKYRDEMKTYFVLESLETLRKNGRLTGLKAFMANALNIKPVMGTDGKGTICQLDQARGITKALKKMIELLAKEAENSEGKILAISHCNCKERAEFVKAELEKVVKTKEILILDTAGISSLYAGDGGIIVVM